MTNATNPVAATAPPTQDELVRSLVNGERRFHELPRDLSPEEAAEIRRRALEEMTRTPLSNIAHHSLDVTRASRRNCENFIGVAQVPMGICGPLRHSAGVRSASSFLRIAALIECTSTP